MPLLAKTEPIHDVLVVAAFLAMLADGMADANRRVLFLASSSGAPARTLSNRVGLFPYLALCGLVRSGDGSCRRRVTGRPLAVGATFAGVDFLVVSDRLLCGWLARTQGPRFRLCAFAGSAILMGHLFIFRPWHLPDLAAWLPIVPPPPFRHPYVPPPWNWAEAVRQLLPLGISRLRRLFSDDRLLYGPLDAPVADHRDADDKHAQHHIRGHGRRNRHEGDVVRAWHSPRHLPCRLPCRGETGDYRTE